MCDVVGGGMALKIGFDVSKVHIWPSESSFQAVNRDYKLSASPPAPSLSFATFSTMMIMDSPSVTINKPSI